MEERGAAACLARIALPREEQAREKILAQAVRRLHRAPLANDRERAHRRGLANGEEIEV